jgi:hypothetical protein
VPWPQGMGLSRDRSGPQPEPGVVAHALVRAASPLVATPLERQTVCPDRTLGLGTAEHPDESGCGTHECVRHKPALAREKARLMYPGAFE